MGIKETAIRLAVKKGVKYLKEDVNNNSIKLIDKGIKLTEGKDLYQRLAQHAHTQAADDRHDDAGDHEHRAQRGFFLENLGPCLQDHGKHDKGDDEADKLLHNKYLAFL